MEKKYTIGYIYPESDICPADKVFIKLLKKRFNLLLFPLEKQVEEEQIEEQAKSCKLIFNNAVYEPFTWEAIELSKTFEEFGAKVINSSRSFYYQEDKWMFYLECLEHKIPTPLTHFIPRKLNYNKKQIKKILIEGPIVIKAVFSDNGLCVERAKTLQEFERKIKKIINKNPISPVIAQKFIVNDGVSYRVTMVENKIVQCITKKGETWEQTGSKESERYTRFKPDKKLKELCKKASRAFGMKWYGLDLLKSNSNWYLIEVNSCPGIGWFYCDMEKVANKFVNYLYQEIKKLSK
jgi:glutathione synthase/RimK-type ligase-like ATP-grasp enzyme